MAAFVAACRAEVLSERTIEFYLERLNAYRVFAGADDHDLTLADVDLEVGRAWLADLVERGRKAATVAARAPRCWERSDADRSHPTGGCERRVRLQRQPLWAGRYAPPCHPVRR